MDHYRVTLPWNPNDDEEGTYCDTVQAANVDDAYRALAEDMAAHKDSECTTDEERANYIQALLDCGTGSADNVSDLLVSCIETVFGIRGNVCMDSLGKLLKDHQADYVQPYQAPRAA